MCRTAAWVRMIIGITLSLFWSIKVSAQVDNTFRLGYFEGGPYPGHAELRGEFARQLQAVLPEEYQIAFVPEGYRSAGWKRDSCRIMARELTRVEGMDLVVAVGPWVVEDLLAAGFERPILAMHQFDPVAQGLVGAHGRPAAPNLTVHAKPGQVEDDLRALAELIEPKKIGVLYFPSGDERQAVVSKVDSVARRLGFSVVSSEGYDNYGTFAFFKAFQELPKDIDAVYLPPLWGMNEIKVVEFFKALARSAIPSFTSEGHYLVELGALASNAAFAAASDARYNARKAARILQGESPASLPIKFRGGTALAVNEQTARACGVVMATVTLDEAYRVPADRDESAPYYTLAGAVGRALSYNPGYLARFEAVEAAVQAARQAYAPYLPQVAADASVAHLDEHTVANSAGVLERDPWRASIFLRQQVFSLETIRTIRAAARQRDLESINLQQARLDLELAVTAAFLTCLRAQETSAVEQRYRMLIDRNIEIAGTRMLVEDAGEIDLLRWKDERHKATARVIQGERGLEAAAVLLNVLFNLPGDSPLTLDTAGFSLRQFWYSYDFIQVIMPTESTEARTADHLVGVALAQNPRLRSYDVSIAIQKDLLARNTARYFPTADFRATLQLADQLVDNPPYFEEETTTWSVWGGLTLPLFLGTDRIRERSRLKAYLSQVEFEKDAVSLDVMGRVRTGLKRLQAALGASPRVIRAAELATENLRLIISEYDAGRLGLGDLTDGVENAREAELLAIAARYEFYYSMATLVHDIGWPTRDGGTFMDELFRRLREQSGG